MAGTEPKIAAIEMPMFNIGVLGLTLIGDTPLISHAWSMTLVGLHTKARAVYALAAIEDQDDSRAGYAVRAPLTSMLYGVRLAENVARVIGLGDAVVAVA